MKLVITDTNWADEMDVWGFELMSDHAYTAAIEAINLAFTVQDSFNIYIGSNEDIDVSSSNYIKHFRIQDINEENINVLKNIFGSTSQGTTMFEKLLETAFDILCEEDEHQDKYNELVKIVYPNC